LTVRRTSIYASAVCVYSLSSLDRAFSGPYKYQADAQAAWARVANKAAGQQVKQVLPKVIWEQRVALAQLRNKVPSVTIGRPKFTTKLPRPSPSTITAPI